MPLLARVQHDLLEILGVEGVENIEEVFSRRCLPCWILVGEVRHHGSVLLELGVEGLHRDFLVVWDLDRPVLRLLHQLLLAYKDILQEVLIDHALIREVELLYYGVNDERDNYLQCWSKY